MGRILLTEEEVDKIIGAPKEITEDISWSSVGRFHKSEVNIKNKLKVDLKLYLNANARFPSFYSFTLILNGCYRIAGLDVSGSHTNKHTDKNKWKNQAHKHRWTDKCRDSWAYTPKISITSVEEAFRDFCQECRIEFKGKFEPLPSRQLSLFGI